jgi:hypothetical protein
MFLWRSLRPNALTILLGYLARPPRAAAAAAPPEAPRTGPEAAGFGPKPETRDR